MTEINQDQNYKLIIILRYEIRFKRWQLFYIAQLYYINYCRNHSPPNYLSRYRRRQVVARICKILRYLMNKTIDSSLDLSISHLCSLILDRAIFTTRHMDWDRHKYARMCTEGCELFS